MQIHPTFHVSLIEKAPQNTKQYSPRVKNKELNKYKVEEILGDAVLENKQHYLVKWKGYPQLDSTWEPIKNLENAQGALQHYQKLQSQNQKERGHC
ncbi:hypothetical protein AJ80_10090 [Polytolypa hystricis UAMH7299]|uniref:Chromo domain-containing protein n=1 Tax=Polytolypa hystricis (strain UAMH7299) TaxID=1447883 RepID=A0A2B7WEA4_POLH7|nr:hypothetical protein AJ80_10090 [Polytolypa hystricis UAMH7299]